MVKPDAPFAHLTIETSGSRRSFFSAGFFRLRGTALSLKRFPRKDRPRTDLRSLIL